MKTFITIVALLFGLAAHAQTPPTPVYLNAYNFSTASSPTFSCSPAPCPSPYQGGAITVTIADSTTGAPCTAYIVYGTALDGSGNIVSPVSGTSYNFTATGSLYAQIQGCPGYNNSAVSLWSGTFVLSAGIVGTPLPCGRTAVTGTAFTCIYGSGLLAGDSYKLVCYTEPATTPTFTSPTATVANSYANHLGTWIFSGVTTGATTISGNVAASFGPATCLMWEVSNLVSSSPVDQVSAFASKTGTGNPTSWTGQITTTNANDYVCGYGYSASGGQTYTAGTGFTLVASGTYSTNPQQLVVECANYYNLVTVSPGLTLTNSISAIYGTDSTKVQ